MASYLSFLILLLTFPHHTGKYSELFTLLKGTNSQTNFQAMDVWNFEESPYTY